MSIFASVNALMNRYTTLSNAQATNIYNVWNAVINNWDQLVLHDPDIQAALQTANTMASHTDQNQDITRMQAQGIPLNTRDISVTRAQGDHVKKLYAILLAFRSCSNAANAGHFVQFFATIGNGFTGTATDLRTLCGDFNHMYMLDEISGYIRQLATGAFQPDMQYFAAFPRIRPYPIVRDTMTVSC